MYIGLAIAIVIRYEYSYIRFQRPLLLNVLWPAAGNAKARAFIHLISTSQYRLQGPEYHVKGLKISIETSKTLKIF